MDGKKSIYSHKYSDSLSKHENIVLFAEMCYTPKLGTTPSYNKLNNVLSKSFRQH